MKALWPWKDRSLRTISYVKWCSFVFIFGYYFSARRSVIVTSVAEIWKCVALGVMGQNTWEIRRIFIRIFLVAYCIPYSPIPARVRVRILSPEVRGPNRGTGRPGPSRWLSCPYPYFIFLRFSSCSPNQTFLSFWSHFRMDRRKLKLISFLKFYEILDVF